MAIYIQSGSGTGSGTEASPYFFDTQYSDAFASAVADSSKLLIYENGTYTWTNAIASDSNVGDTSNQITHKAKNLHEAIFTHSSGLTGITGDPTLKWDSVKVVTVDHWAGYNQYKNHFILNSCHYISRKYSTFSSLTATGTIFEPELGEQSATAMRIVTSTTNTLINCTCIDRNNYSSTYSAGYFMAGGTAKNTIFYATGSRSVGPFGAGTLTNCASFNVNTTGATVTTDPQFVDAPNGDLRLRPSSPCINAGTAS